MSPPREPAGAPTLILVPTPLERARLEALGGFGRGHGLLETCGFGPLAAAARAAALLERLGPRRVLLVGIAGTCDPAVLGVGEAATFGQVRLDGVGAGEGPGRLGPVALGLEPGPGVGDSLPLASEGPVLLTVCAASAGAAQAAERATRFSAAAEDMEAFGVALACHLARTPLTVVRGMSNVAGDRERAGWRIDRALVAARERALAELTR